MAKTMKFDERGDSEGLQVLFDSIAARPPKPRREAVSKAGPIGDADDLEALFDSAAEEYGKVSAIATPLPAARTTLAVHLIPRGAESAPPLDLPIPNEVFNRVGHMARKLHDMLHELGYEELRRDTARAIPDARQRLAYMAQMMEQAASRVLNATDIANPIQERIQREGEGLSERWEKLFVGHLSIEEFKELAMDTRAFLKRLPEATRATNAQLTEIMMAQDFQDLTGQVIKKVVEMSQRLEDQLVHLLVEVVPADKREVVESLLNGPVISAAGRGDVVVGETQVDELLDSLGF